MVVLPTSIRMDFPGLKNYILFLDTASYGLPSIHAINRLRDFVEQWTNVEELENMLTPLIGELRKKIAFMLEASPDNIGFCTNTTDGLKRVLGSLRIPSGGNLVSTDLIFPTVASLAKSFCRINKCSIRICRGGGRYDLGCYEKLIDDETRIVLVESVQWISGWRLRLNELAELAHAHGALLIVDAVQHAGSFKLTAKDGADAIVSGGQKWLLTPFFGAGFFYVSSDLLETLDPGLYGLKNTKPPREGWEEYWPNPNKDPWENRALPKSAVKLEWGGGFPLVPLSLLDANIAYIEMLGLDNVTEHIISVKKYLVDEILSRGYEILGFDEDKNTWSGITTFTTKRNMEAERRIVEALSRRNIEVSYRGARGIGGIRVSVHLYNTKEDVDVFLQYFDKALENNR